MYLNVYVNTEAAEPVYDRNVHIDYPVWMWDV